MICQHGHVSWFFFSVLFVYIKKFHCVMHSSLFTDKHSAISLQITNFTCLFNQHTIYISHSIPQMMFVDLHVSRFFTYLFSFWCFFEAFKYVCQVIDKQNQWNKICKSPLDKTHPIDGEINRKNYTENLLFNLENFLVSLHFVFKELRHFCLKTWLK